MVCGIVFLIICILQTQYYKICSKIIVLVLYRKAPKLYQRGESDAAVVLMVNINTAAESEKQKEVNRKMRIV